MNKVRIGIPLGSKASTFSRLPHYSMEKKYFEALTNVGALPIAIPYEAENFDEYMALVDGILIPGGSFASPAQWYEEEGIELPKAESWAYFFEKVARYALEKQMPVLGICAGMQFMGALSGGKMTVNVHKKLASTLDHLNGAPKEEPYHNVHIEEGSQLHNITGVTNLKVNSAHTEALVNVGEQCTISAKAEDGCIEAIEITDHPFAIGVQWHPEFFCTNPNDPNYKLMKAFINAAEKNRR